MVEFEKGYDTLVGERVTLSGGQKQRVAIARTIIRDCDVLIFDDSLSVADTHTDAIIRMNCASAARESQHSSSRTDLDAQGSRPILC